MWHFVLLNIIVFNDVLIILNIYIYISLLICRLMQYATLKQNIYCICGSQPIFFCHTFCVACAKAYSTLYFKKINKLCYTTHQTKRRSLQPPPPFPYARKKCSEAYLNIMCSYGTAMPRSFTCLIMPVP